MAKVDEKINKLQLLKEKVKRCKKPDDLARRLNSYLLESESSVELAHVLHSLQENNQGCKQLSVCNEIIVKFTNKAVRSNNAFEWLQSINNLLKQYQSMGERYLLTYMFQSIIAYSIFHYLIQKLEIVYIQRLHYLKII